MIPSGVVNRTCNNLQASVLSLPCYLEGYIARDTPGVYDGNLLPDSLVLDTVFGASDLAVQAVSVVAACDVDINTVLTVAPRVYRVCALYVCGRDGATNPRLHAHGWLHGDVPQPRAASNAETRRVRQTH
eukprot:m.527984 g.527984  ORF g.527984 m.527984 type:complete len:130 (-) comp22015_c0_seq4:736-1125(-)